MFQNPHVCEMAPNVGHEKLHEEFVREYNRKEMSETLDRAKAWRRGQRGVVTKYVQEVKALVDAESIGSGSRRRLNTLFKLLEEKQGVLKALDNEVVTTCPTEDIEREVQEAEEVYEKIVESLAAIEHVKAESTVRGTGVGPSDGEHSSSCEPSVPRDELIVCTNTSKSGAPAVSRSGSHDELNVTHDQTRLYMQ